MDRRRFNAFTAFAAIGALSRDVQLEAGQTQRKKNVDEKVEQTPIFAAHAAGGSEPERSSIRLEDDESISLRFFGASTADLFTRETEQSFRGVLKNNFVANAGNGSPAGFVHASPPGQIWGGTMWTRDGGTFMHELVMRGYYEHAALVAECLMALVEKNQDGFYAFPMYFTDLSQERSTGHPP